MICRNCESTMGFSGVFDTGSIGNVKGRGRLSDELVDIAFNLFLCPSCGAICKENLWDGRGLLWMYDDNTTEHLPHNVQV